MRRRHFLAGIASAALWTDLGSAHGTGPAAFLTSAARPDNSTWLVGLSETGAEVFALPLPGRGHAAAAHPVRAEAVAFARRPGTFATVIDCASGREIARLEAPEGRHFYGHGAFSPDGAWLLTTENEIDTGAGRLGLWNVTQGYVRATEISSGGMGPHEIIALPSGGYAVANGGIHTHPDMGRAMLNLDTMQPNLSYFDASFARTESIAPPPDLHQASIRHIASDARGRVAIALQWKGHPGTQVPLCAIHERGRPLTFIAHPEVSALRHYAGSIAVNSDGTEVLVTGPKGDRMLCYNGDQGSPIGAHMLNNSAGVAARGARYAVTVAGALALGQFGATPEEVETPGWSWENHVIALPDRKSSAR